MKYSTHRVIQLSQVADRLLATAGECSRAAKNAASIRNRTMAIRFASRAWDARSLREYICKKLAEAA